MIVGYAFVVADLLHFGHLVFLEECRRYCEFLIVGVYTDELTETYKRRPIIPFDERASLIASLRIVDKVVKVENRDASVMMKKLEAEGHEISLLFHGNDWSPETDEDLRSAKEYIEGIGGRLVQPVYYREQTTTKIIKKLRERPATLEPWMTVGYADMAADLLHWGHVRFLAGCKEVCDYLIVGMEPDESMIENKRTPVIAYDGRVEMIGALACVDEVRMNLSWDAVGTMKALVAEGYNLRYWFHGDDEAYPSCVAYIESVGGEAVVTTYVKGVSSTELIERIINCRADLPHASKRYERNLT